MSELKNYTSSREKVTNELPKSNITNTSDKTNNSSPIKLVEVTKFTTNLEEIARIKASPNPSTNGSSTEPTFNARILWPDMIRTPINPWSFTCREIIDKLGSELPVIQESKRIMEKCLLYFYTLKKKLNLFDHSYTASCILFFRYWFLYGLPNNLIDCINISQGILVTACKGTENNRPIDAYVKATCEFIAKELHGNKIANIDKMKWEIRDKLVDNEKKILCDFGFDLNIENPKEMIEEMFSGYYRYNRDQNLDVEFKKIFPKILQEVRNFIVQAVTQPTCLLCDGFTFIQLALIFCGIQYKKIVNNNFKYPRNFFKEKFPIIMDPKKMEDLFTDYCILEENFFDLKSNKGDKLQISKIEIEDILDEDENNEEKIHDPYDYNLIKSGEVTEEFLNHTKARLHDLLGKIKEESKKRKPTEKIESNDPSKRVKL